MRLRLQLLSFLWLFYAVASAQESTASAHVSTFSIDAPQLGQARKIWIWLPEDYARSSRKYPVLYMHDAQNVFDAKTSFAGEWRVDETLDSLHARVIVVAIEHGNEKRMDELTPFANSKYGGGKADAYLDFLVHTLKPEIDRRYRTRTSKKDTAIMGSSLGGLVSLYALAKYPDVFGKAGVFSPAFWFSDKISELARQTDFNRTKIYFLCGDKESEEMVPDMERMIGIVQKNKAATAQKIVPGGQHNEKLWRDNFAQAFLWLFGK